MVRESFIKNISMLLERNGLTAKRMCNDLGISPAIYTEWVHGRAFPRAEKLDAIAEYFHVSVSDLLSDPEAEGENLASIYLDKVLFEYASKISKLDESQKEKIFSYIDFIVGQ